MHIKIASIMLVASVLGLSAIIPAAYAQSQASEAIQAIAGGFETITIQQSESEIVITITKEGSTPTPIDNSTGNVTVPEEPIIIVPPNNETGQNGTIVVPPIVNQTGNVTLPEPPVVVIDPDGNNTVVQPPSNVTVIDNGTVVVHPPDQNVTTTPGNVTVVDPPVQNVTEPTEPQQPPCECPQPGVEGGAPDIQFPNATISNDTTIVRPDTEPGEDTGNGNGGNGEDNNGGG